MFDVTDIWYFSYGRPGVVYTGVHDEDTAVLQILPNGGKVEIIVWLLGAALGERIFCIATSHHVVPGQCHLPLAIVRHAEAESSSRESLPIGVGEVREKTERLRFNEELIINNNKCTAVNILLGKMNIYDVRLSASPVTSFSLL